MTNRELLTVPLAHKIPAAEALRLGASENRDYQPGENITVPRAAAEMLAAAAQLQVSPHDREAVARLLRRAPAPEAAPVQAAPERMPPAQPAQPAAPAQSQLPAVPPAAPAPAVVPEAPAAAPQAAPSAVLQVSRD